jgi:methylated-DNA-[protein]-cysteine S-methyltransferase
MNGTPFQLEVWQILQNIPYGELITYRKIADLIAKKRGIAKMSARAIGGSVGRNPISILVPCHRVVGSDGKMTGYAGGIEKKIKLLKLENAI